MATYDIPGPGRMVGTSADDVFIVDDVHDQIIEAADGGYDIAYSRVSWTLTAGSHVELLSADTVSAVVDMNLTGNEFDQVIFGTYGRNVLDGGGGRDTLRGFLGDDTYIADTHDTIIEEAGEGHDTVRARGDYYLSETAHIERLETADFYGTANTILRGNAMAQVILGNQGQNIIVGGGGADFLAGSGGDDLYWLTGGDDVVQEWWGEGIDKVYVDTSYILTANVENLQWYAFWDLTAAALTGNELSNEITGNMGYNVLRGGGGADVLSGLGGDDAYYVDSDDVIQEAAEYVRETDGARFAGGNDHAYASSNYTLGAGVHVEMLSVAHGTRGSINLTGNELSQTINGHDGFNWLSGEGGNDTLFGFNGNDILDGGSGADHMNGGNGNDTYYVDDAGDVVFEYVDPGIDTVNTSLQEYRLGAFVENLTVLETGGPGGRYYGNEMDNVITMSSKGGMVDGGLGNDTIRCGSGVDKVAFYYAGKPADTLHGFNFQQDKILLDVSGNSAFKGLRDLDLRAQFRTWENWNGETNVLVWDKATGTLYIVPPTLPGPGGYTFFGICKFAAGSTFNISCVEKYYGANLMEEEVGGSAAFSADDSGASSFSLAAPGAFQSNSDDVSAGLHAMDLRPRNLFDLTETYFAV